jgi:hypothetical protein
MKKVLIKFFFCIKGTKNPFITGGEARNRRYSKNMHKRFLPKKEDIKGL